MDDLISVEEDIVKIDPFLVLSQPQRTCPELYTKKWLSADSCFHRPHILQEQQLKNKQTAWNLYHMKSLLLNHSTSAFTVHGNVISKRPQTHSLSQRGRWAKMYDCTMPLPTGCHQQQNDPIFMSSPPFDNTGHVQDHVPWLRACAGQEFVSHGKSLTKS